ncbi:hypothetical protein MPL1032_140007 [Mesorhizobium plurifarium]|uniref:Uncharacterized protein n=1 Tax=Mesorhizobium plurifarium TaxID=69974 RepID=A0A0K2VR44_MESPL|nr:hypothetical protein MPL1032_140007 [Mesorhizobium plurifarium]
MKVSELTTGPSRRYDGIATRLSPLSLHNINKLGSSRRHVISLAALAKNIDAMSLVCD